MKRFVAIVILSVLLLNIVATYFYFGVRLMQIRMEMRAELKNKPTGELQQFIFKKEEFLKMRISDDEVEIDDKMYDIARIVVNENQVSIFCLHDADEDSLLSFLDTVTKNSSKDKKPVPGAVVGFMSLIFTLTKTTFNSSALASFTSGNTAYAFSLKTASQSILTPPPKF